MLLEVIPRPERQHGLGATHLFLPSVAPGHVFSFESFMAMKTYELRCSLLIPGFRDQGTDLLFHGAPPLVLALSERLFIVCPSWRNIDLKETPMSLLSLNDQEGTATVR